jgi:aminomethyltransferase
MGYVAPEFVRPGTELQVDVRGRVEAARVVELPFYRRDKAATGGHALNTKGPQH